MEKNNQERLMTGLMVPACMEAEMKASAKSIAATIGAMNNGMLMSVPNWKEATGCFDLSDISVLLSGIESYERAETLAKHLVDCFKDFVNDPSAPAESERQMWRQKHCLEMKLTDDMATVFFSKINRILEKHPLSPDSRAMHSLQQMMENMQPKAASQPDDTPPREEAATPPNQDIPLADENLTALEQRDTERLHRCILQLMQEKDGEGKDLVGHERQWYIIYYIVTAEGILTDNMKDFCERMEPYNDHYRIKVNYKNIRRAKTTLPENFNLNTSLKETKYQKIDTLVQIRRIASRFSRILKEHGYYTKLFP
jgi:hypothetical protein